MTLRLAPGPLGGRVAAVPAKSEAHRHLICAALADRPTCIGRPGSSEDIAATLGCLRALGTVIAAEGDSLTVTPPGGPADGAVLDCGESGTTLRLVLPVAAALCGHVHVTGRGRLPLRPLGGLLEAMGRNGVACSQGRLPLTTRGRLQSGVFRLPGNVSSQYISGLLLALPLLPGDSEIRLTTPLESAPYVAMTRHVQGQYGITTHRRAWGFAIPGGQRYRSPGKAYVGGDWSGAAFFLAAGALGNPVTVTGLAEASAQGDRRVVDYLRRLGAEVTVGGDAVTVGPGALAGCRLDIGDTPDLLPPLAMVAACATGETRFLNAARLRLKESDRLEAAVGLICGLGGAAEARGGTLWVGGGGLRGGSADSLGDHRMAMAAAVAATACKTPVMLTGAQAVAKSYPGFWADYAQLGGIHSVI